MEQVALFDEIKTIFNKNGYRLYMIGGTSRDYLLSTVINDFDFVTDATPDEMLTFLEHADDTFSKFGFIKLKYKEYKCDITTLRIEGEYKDYRHPSYIKFCKEPELDYVRRDFTINAIYIDENYKIVDFCGGIEDLKQGIIRFIGDPVKRIKEDPLRILRAERFAKRLSFKIEKNTLDAINEYRYLIEKLNPDKIYQESKKK